MALSDDMWALINALVGLVSVLGMGVAHWLSTAYIRKANREEKAAMRRQ